MVAKQRGLARCSRPQFVCVKCSKQERRWGSSSTTSGSRGESNTGSCGRAVLKPVLQDRPSSATAGSGVWGLDGEEDGAEGDLEPVDAFERRQAKLAVVG